MFDSMGMFDSIKVSVELPQYGWSLHHDYFQTKDLENCMVNYEITSDGLLVEKIYNRVFEEDGSYSDKQPEVIIKETQHTGVINFYTLVGKELVTFTAKFENGELKSIETSP